MHLSGTESLCNPEAPHMIPFPFLFGGMNWVKILVIPSNRLAFGREEPGSGARTRRPRWKAFRLSMAAEVVMLIEEYDRQRKWFHGLSWRSRSPNSVFQHPSLCTSQCLPRIETQYSSNEAGHILVLGGSASIWPIQPTLKSIDLERICIVAVIRQRLPTLIVHRASAVLPISDATLALYSPNL